MVGIRTGREITFINSLFSGLPSGGDDCTARGRSNPGCGAQFEPCRAVVQSLSNDHQTRFDMMKGEQGCAGGMASLLGIHADALTAGKTATWRQSPPALLLGLQRQGRNRTAKSRECRRRGGHLVRGLRPLNGHCAKPVGAAQTLSYPLALELFQMPPVAKSFKELEVLLGASGLSAGGATA